MSQLERDDFVYLDAVPQGVSITEIYTYELKVRANPDTLLVNGVDHPERPRGEVRIDMPYDGYDSLPAEVAAHLEKHLQDTENLQGQIGWLALGKPLDWEGNWDPQPGLEELHGVRIPLLKLDALSPRDWISDELRAVICHTYIPEAPRYLPLQVEMRVYDSAEDYLLKFPETVRQVKNLKTLQEILKKLNSPSLEGGQLVIDLIVTVNLPIMLARPGEQEQPVQVMLDELGLLWPTIAPDWQLKLLVYLSKEKRFNEVKWRYNPDPGAVEVHHLLLEPEPVTAVTTLLPYHCRLRLVLSSAGEVIGAVQAEESDRLDGWVQVRLEDCLLSSRQAAWLDARGWRMPLSGDSDKRKQRSLLTTQSLLKGRFNAIPSEQFQQRSSAVYRQWYFHGLKFTTARLDDIAAALRDIGYSLENEPQLFSVREQADGPAYQGGAVMGRQVSVRPDSSPVVLDIQVWALPVAHADTRRERDIPEGGVVSTELGTCDLIIQVRGQVNGAGSQLALDVEQLMTNLKNRFTAIVDLR